MSARLKGFWHEMNFLVHTKNKAVANYSHPTPQNDRNLIYKIPTEFLNKKANVFQDMIWNDAKVGWTSEPLTMVPVLLKLFSPLVIPVVNQDTKFADFSKVTNSSQRMRWTSSNLQCFTIGNLSRENVCVFFILGDLLIPKCSNN